MFVVAASWDSVIKLMGLFLSARLVFFFFPFSVRGSSDPEIRIIDHDLSFGQLFRSATDCLCEKKQGKKSRKINRFPLSGWAVSLACQWSCYNGGTRVTQAHTQSLLTRGKHADRHREQVGTQICTSSSRPRRYRARPPHGKGRAP